ncbi:unnamed protein product [Orchesella dallaii]|uniref:C2H2-type domain-containing protein n=1 Tax=Orchesella dallaii TaxID=48710 RepID=A0ABP1RR62_9HEXA
MTSGGGGRRNVEVIRELRSSLMQKCEEKNRGILPNVEVVPMRVRERGEDDDDVEENIKKFGCLKMELQDSFHSDDNDDDYNDNEEDITSDPDPDYNPPTHVKLNEGIENSIDVKLCEHCNESFFDERDEEFHKHLQKHEHSLQLKRFPCYFCYKSFALLQTRQFHVNIRHSGMMKCEVSSSSCSQKFISHTEYNQHLTGHFQDEEEEDKKLHFCNVCQLGFINPDLLQLHTLLHTKPSETSIRNQKYKCPHAHCEAGFSKPERLQDHFNVNHGVKLAHHKCWECDAAFLTSQTLYHHIKVQRQKQNQEAKPKPSSHQPPKKFRKWPIKCDLCEKELKDSKQRINHMYNRHNPLSCDLCGEHFNGYASYSYHVLIKHKDASDAYPCTKCDKKFQTSLGLRKHIERVHPPKTHEKQKSQEDEGETRPTFRRRDGEQHICHLCGVHFKLERYLLRHMTRMHPQSAGDVISNPQKYECSHCHLHFPYNDVFQDHVRYCSLGVLGMSECKICGKPLAHLVPGRIRTHLMTHMSAEERELQNGKRKQFVCHLCGKQTVSKSGLKYHHAKCHDEKGKLKCPECPQFYFMRTLLRNHILKMHGKEKAEELIPRKRNSGPKQRALGRGQKCQFPSCGLSFVMRVKGETPRRDHVKQCHSRDGYSFMCEECGKVCGDVGMLEKHEKIHEVKEHKCPQCPKSYSRKEGMENHVKYVHCGGEKKPMGFKCNRPNCEERFETKYSLVTHLRGVHFVMPRRSRGVKRKAARGRT